MSHILACLDASEYATSVTDYANWAAKRITASVELLHVIQRKDAARARRDLSGAVGLGAKSDLLEELARIDEEEARLSRDRGRLILAAAAERASEAGVETVTQTHRHGGIVETIIEREADADLVVIGKRGASSEFAPGHLGSKVERVVRASERPVLVASRKFAEPSRLLLAYDGGKSARRAASYIGNSPDFTDLPVHVIFAGKDRDASRNIIASAKTLMPKHDVTDCLADEDPDELIKSEMRDGDLLVMGAYGHSPLRAMIVGSTTTEMLRVPNLPVMMFR
ncbi:MAG: universal stress protein [Pacificimonas sp.]